MDSRSDSPDILDVNDLEEFPELVEKFSNEPIVSQFFEKQNETQNQNYKRSYTQYIEKELQNLESDSDDLAQLSDDISSLQEDSTKIQVNLKNYKQLENKLGLFIEDIVITPDTIRNICVADVNEIYLEYLLALNRKAVFADISPSNEVNHENSGQTLSKKEIKAIGDISGELDKLRIKAVTKVREFLIYRIYSLRKPKTNIQILQQTLLVKYTYFMKFLFKFAPKFGEEVKGIYIDTMSKIYLSYFKAYISSLLKLQIEVATKYDLIGAQESSYSKKKGMGGVFSSNISGGKQKTTDRSEVLNDESPCIIPHVAERNQEKYTFDCLFRSIQLLLIDTVSSEYLFDSEFFSRVDPNSIFAAIFDKILILHRENLEHIIENSYDVLGLFIVFGLTQSNIQTMRRRNINLPHFNSYLHDLKKSTWNRIKQVLDLNIDSVKKFITSNPSASDFRPHYMSRRYAEFASSISALNINFEEYRTAFDNYQFILKSHIEQLLSKFSHTLGTKKLQNVFMINNYDLIISVFEERGVTSDAYQAFKTFYNAEVKQFVEDELLMYMPDIVNISKQIDPNANEWKIDPVLVERIAHDFSVNWRGVIDKLNADVLKYFSNFKNGSEILKQALNQLANYYSPFEDAVKKHFKNSTFRKDVVTISTIRFEMQKHLSHSF